MRTILIAAFAASLAVSSANAKDVPKYRGKPLHFWVEQLKTAGEEQEVQAASWAIARFEEDAEPAFPVLFEILDDRDPSYRERAYKTFQRLEKYAMPALPSLIQRLKSEKVRDAREIIELLERLGPEAKEASPVLARFLDAKDPSLTKTALRALCAIGSPASDAINSKRNAILSAMDSAAKDHEFQRDSDKLKRGFEEVIVMLKAVGPGSIPLLLEIVRQKDADYRQVALFAIAQFRPADKVDTTAIKTILKQEDVDKDTRLVAAIALWNLDKDKSVLPFFSATLDGAEPLYKSLIFNVVDELGPQAKDLLPKLKAELTRLESQSPPKALNTQPQLATELDPSPPPRAELLVKLGAFIYDKDDLKRLIQKIEAK